jgi:RNA polymerase primary sigma factor
MATTKTTTRQSEPEMTGAKKKGRPSKSAQSKKDALLRLTTDSGGKVENAEDRRMRLKNLILLGKERGYLTYAEINDHLPDDMLDAEQIEGIISMINDMGIQVYDEAPAAEDLLMSESPAPVAHEDAVE